MTGPERARLALALGRRVGRGTGGGVHRAALACAAFLTLVTLWFLVAAHTVHEQRDQRMAARNPVPVAQGESARAVARWWERPDQVGDRGATVVFLRSLRPGAPPPPGLDRWPRPGEAYVSPALLAAAADVRDRYGTPAGTIGQEGLADAAELVAYVNPRQPDYFRKTHEPSSYISGFGDADRSLFPMFFVSSHQFDRGLAELDIVVLLMAALPCAALVLVAVRSRAEIRDRRLALLDALGAPTPTRALVLAGEAWAPLGAGTLAAAVVLGSVSLTTPTLPFTGYQVWSRDLRAALPQLPLVALGVLLGLVLLTVLAGIRRPPSGGTRPADRPVKARARRARWVPVLFGAGLVVAAWGSEERGVFGRSAFVAGSVVALVALPYAAARVARVLGRAIAVRGRAKGDPVRIVAGRWLAARPATLARLSAALVVGLGVVTIGQVLTSQLAGPLEAARARAGAAGGELVQVRSRDDAGTVPAFIRAVGADVTLRYSPEPGTSESDPRVRLTGRCRALEALGRMTSCPARPRPVREVFGQLTPMGKEVFGGQEMTSAPVASVCACRAPEGGEDVADGLIVVNRGGPAAVDRIKQAAYAHLIGPLISAPGQGWYMGAAAQAAQVRWLMDVVLIGLAALVAAGALGAAGIFLEQAKALGPLATFRTDRRYYRGIAAWNLAVPLGAVGVAGVAVAALLGGLLINLGKGGWMSAGLLGAGAAVVVAAGGAVAAACGRVAARRAAAWRPSGD
ncbi:hypothetical protein [Streptomyces sp. MST-110588]|uniref:hypothetical protein n=1 Tax=Streptomyces sp. MST-110588 TaxID=2833628 RepID=UPI001F5C1C9A|nr:hypothetical protein [Streptomyces sp. MST-110588]UNO41233.1 hypothetical protein KGS77_18705 [Streptomyces sp. MST-110588]